MRTPLINRDVESSVDCRDMLTFLAATIEKYYCLICYEKKNS
jgi:hypothetical protein